MHTAIISPGLNMAAAAGQACFSGQGLPAVQAFPLNKIARVYTHRPKSTGRINLLLNKSLPAVQIHHPTKVYRLYRFITKGLSAVQTCHLKIYRLFI